MLNNDVLALKMTLIALTLTSYFSVTGVIIFYMIDAPLYLPVHVFIIISSTIVLLVIIAAILISDFETYV